MAEQYINYSIDSMNSNSMKSKNPKSGIHKEDYIKTIDTSGNNPQCNQGGNMIVENGPIKLRTRKITEKESLRLMGFYLK